MSTTFKIMAVPMDGVGHINSCLGVCDMIVERGHEVVFVTSESWRNYIENYNYRVITYNVKEEKSDIKTWSKIWVSDCGPNVSLAEREAEILKMAFRELVTLVKSRHDSLKEIVESYKPNLILSDTLVSQPAIEASGIPWVNLWSANPARIYWEHVPPADSGYPTNSDRKLWKEFDDIIRAGVMDSLIVYKEWLKQHNIELNSQDFLNDSPYLNLYSFPEDIDYTDIALTPKGWYRLDCVIRKSKNAKETQIPEGFLSKDKKTIYFSMGTLGSGNVSLMKKLVSALSKIDAKVIVSKGPFHDEYELSDNMWGQQYVNQLQILPLVDLVITHGGNNTVVESLYFGKPMIVLPLFGDQPDNAQRIKEKQLGLRLDPFNIAEKELIDAVNKIFGDQDLYKRLKNISDKIKNSNRKTEIVSLIESIVKDKIKL